MVQTNMKKEQYLTTRKAAEVLEVNQHTIQAWVENGTLNAWKTAGGHRRIALSSIYAFMEKKRQELNLESNESEERMRLIVVEDDKHITEIYQIYFESWDFPIDVEFVENGVDGLLLIGQSQPDFIITDLIMPKMDGFEMLWSLFRNPNFHYLDIIVITVLDDIEIESHGGLPKGVNIIRKPIPFEKLEGLIKKLLLKYRRKNSVLDGNLNKV